MSWVLPPQYTRHERHLSYFPFSVSTPREALLVTYKVYIAESRWTVILRVYVRYDRKWKPGTGWGREGEGRGGKGRGDGDGRTEI